MRKLLEQYKHTIIKYSVAALILTVPLYLKFPFITIPGSQVSLRLEDFLIFFVFLIWFFLSLPELSKILKRRTTRAILLFWIVGFVSLLSAIFITSTVSPFVGLLHWARRVEYMIPFFIGYSAVKTREDLAFYVKLLFVVVVFATLYAVGQKYWSFPVISTQNSEYAKGIAQRYVPGGHLFSTFAGHYDLAAYLLLTLPLFAVIFAGPKNIVKDLSIKSNSLIVRWIFGGIFLMGLWLLVNAASRISIVSFLGSIVIALFLTRRYVYIPVLVILSILFIGFSSNLIDRYMRIFKVTFEKISMSQQAVAYAADEVTAPERRATPTPSATPAPVFEDRSTSIRLNVEWPRAVRALEKNTILGTGYSSITLATDNDFLRMFGEVGVLGVLSFGLITATILIELIKLIPIPKDYGLEHVYVMCILGSIVGIGLYMVFIDILEASKFAVNFWLLLGFAMGAREFSKK